VKIPAVAAILALLFLCAFPAAGQEALPDEEGPSASAYALGDQVLSISLGPLVPLFYMGFDGSFAGTQLTLGGTGSIAWAAYLSGAIRVGVEIGGVFAFSSPNLNTLLTLPIMARAEYVLSFYPFEIPISLGLGMNIAKYLERRNIDLLIRPGVSAFWAYDSKWSFGLNLSWWCDMQFVPAPDQDQSRIGNFLAVTVSALYHYQ
jgi:hypothetical protein